MRTTLLLLSLFACVLGTRVALADCRPSASGTWSMAVRLSPRSGKACWDDIGVYEGPGCQAGSLRWVMTIACHSRIFVSDHGAVLMLYSSQVSSTANETIMMVFARTGSHLTQRAVRLADLPALPRASRYRFALDNTALHVQLKPEVTLALTSLETLGKVLFTEPLRPQNSIGSPAK
ncbi:MAG TPA: hypothetical protein PKI03_04790 [Pseudomonadota bacterium]|nr:hypothetical protein [Pseudomonadota bacterium]